MAMVHGVAKSQKLFDMIYNWLSWWLIDKGSSCQCRRCGFNTWRRKWQPTPVFLPGKSHWQRSLVGYSPWSCKRVGQDLETKQKTLFTYSFIWGFPGGSEVEVSACNAGDPGSIPGLGRSPGEGNGNPLHILAWGIPWTEDPGRLQSTGSQKVGHDWATSLLRFTYSFIYRANDDTWK